MQIARCVPLSCRLGSYRSLDAQVCCTLHGDVGVAAHDDYGSALSVAAINGPTGCDLTRCDLIVIASQCPMMLADATAIADYPQPSMLKGFDGGQITKWRTGHSRTIAARKLGPIEL